MERETLAMIILILMLAYLVIFKAYRAHKHPAYKSLAYEIRMYIAELFLLAAIKVAPKKDDGVVLVKIVIEYSYGRIKNK